MTEAIPVRLTRHFTFEMAHVLTDYDGPCRNIHGHSFQLEVTVEGMPRQEPGHPKDGMVIDFKDLKQLVNRVIVDPFDHALVVSERMAPEVVSVLQSNFEQVIVLPFQPTCENLLIHFIHSLRPHLPEGVQLRRIKLAETRNSFAEWESRQS